MYLYPVPTPCKFSGYQIGQQNASTDAPRMPQMSIMYTLPPPALLRSRSTPRFSLHIRFFHVSFPCPRRRRLLLIEQLFFSMNPPATGQHLLQRPGSLSPTISTRSVTPIRDMESPIHPHNEVHVDDDNLGGEVEEPEAGLGLVPGRVGLRSGCLEVRAETEECTQSEDKGRGEQDADFGAPAA